MRWVLVVVVLALAACGPTVPDTEDGQKLFVAMCSRCHEVDGRSSPKLRAELGTPDMTTEEWQAAHPTDVIKRTIVHGSKSKKMPAFGAASFSAKQLDALAAHVKTLGARR